MKQVSLILAILSATYSQSNSFHFPVLRSSSITTSWDSTKNWKIYKLQKINRVFQIPIDSLQYQEKATLNDDTIHLYLSEIINLHNTNPVWMGCYLTSYETPDGKVHKAIISHYGGFFYCQPENAFFQIRSDDQHDWLSYLSNAYLKIME